MPVVFTVSTWSSVTMPVMTGTPTGISLTLMTALVTDEYTVSVTPARSIKVAFTRSASPTTASPGVNEVPTPTSAH